MCRRTRAGKRRSRYSRAVNKPAAVAALATLPLLLPATASAKPGVCQRTTIQAVLVQEDRLTPEGVANGRKVSLVRCGDVTDDGNAEALFAFRDVRSDPVGAVARVIIEHEHLCVRICQR